MRGFAHWTCQPGEAAVLWGAALEKLCPINPKLLNESKKTRFTSWLQRLSHQLVFPKLAWKPKGTGVPLATDCLKCVERFFYLIINITLILN